MRQKIRKIMDYKCLGPSITVGKIKKLQNQIRKPQLTQRRRLIHLLSGETRFNIIFLLFQEKELCVCDVADILRSTVSAISHQLKLLKKQGMVSYEKKGQTVFYSLSQHGRRELKGYF